MRNNVSVALQYLASWLAGSGAVAIFNLMEDAATAEIARSQVWQWLHNGIVLASGVPVSRPLVERIVAEEMAKLRAALGAELRRGPLRAGPRPICTGCPGRRFRRVPDRGRLRPGGVSAPGAVVRLSERLASAIGADKLITDPLELATYECDGLLQYRVVPALAVMVRSAGDVRTVVRECAAAGIPFVARGAGTGLSGGAVPDAAGVLIVLAKMRKLLELDVANQRAVVEPGVANLDITRAAAGQGYYYAPDPSSQQVCSIGGNVAENSGGAHCLKYGFTTNHVTGLEVVTADGDTGRARGQGADPPGYDLIGAFVGSEGTLGDRDQVTVRLLRSPQSVQTVLAGFADIDGAGAAVSSIIAAGLVPAALEMMDALAIEAAEAASIATTQPVRVPCSSSNWTARPLDVGRRAGGGRTPLRGHRCLRDSARR